MMIVYCRPSLTCISWCKGGDWHTYIWCHSGRQCHFFFGFFPPLCWCKVASFFFFPQSLSWVFWYHICKGAWWCFSIVSVIGWWIKTCTTIWSYCILLSPSLSPSLYLCYCIHPNVFLHGSMTWPLY